MNKYLKFLGMMVLAVVFMWRCTSDQEPLPDSCTGVVSLTVSASADANCGQTDGSVTVTPTGGVAPYTFSLDGGAAQNSGTFANLAAGTYTITATDANGCSAEVTANILNADGVNAELTTSESSCANPTGSITITATGGAQPYEYSLDNGGFQAGATFNGLAPSEYEVVVRDANGCEVTLQATVLSDVAFAQIQTLVQNNCAVPGCHNGTQAPDFRVANNIVNSANRIQVRTGARSMPPSSSGRSLTDAEIAAIACWVADGAPGS